MVVLGIGVGETCGIHSLATESGLTVRPIVVYIQLFGQTNWSASPSSTPQIRFRFSQSLVFRILVRPSWPEPAEMP